MAPSKGGRKRKSEQQTGPPLKSDIDSLLQEMLENFTAVAELKLALKKEPNNKEKLEQKYFAQFEFQRNKIDLERYKYEGKIPTHAQDRANYLLGACIYN